MRNMITYKKAGVDIDAGNELVRRIKKMAPRIGGFADGISLPKGYKEPVLIGCTDGVGTKLAIAQTLKIHDTIGYDLVGMNVNDLICCGAKPLFFLDYFASGKLDIGVAEKVVRGIVNACKESDCELIGGETAEMPGFYKPGEYDLAGFATGVVEKKKMLRPKDTLKNGDILLGLPSSGPHSNGYSLIRRVIPQREWRAKAKMLLAPTRLYVRPILAALNKFNKQGPTVIKGLVHVTGGGYPDNIPRILPENLRAQVAAHTWEIPPIFHEVKKRSNASWEEMYRTFNMGIGLILAIAPTAVTDVMRFFKDAVYVGQIEKGKKGIRYV